MNRVGKTPTEFVVICLTDTGCALPQIRGVGNDPDHRPARHQMSSIPNVAQTTMTTRIANVAGILEVRSRRDNPVSRPRVSRPRPFRVTFGFSGGQTVVTVDATTANTATGPAYRVLSDVVGFVTAGAAEVLTVEGRREYRKRIKAERAAAKAAAEARWAAEDMAADSDDEDFLGLYGMTREQMAAELDATRQAL